MDHNIPLPDESSWRTRLIQATCLRGISFLPAVYMCFSHPCSKALWIPLLQIPSDFHPPDRVALCVAWRGLCIPNTVGKNLEEHSWIITLTWSRKAEGTKACVKSIGALKMFKGRWCKIRTVWLKPDCLKPNSQSEQHYSHRHNIYNSMPFCTEDFRAILCNFHRKNEWQWAISRE